MKRKLLLSALFCLLALSCVFAGKFSIKAQVSPYSLQSISLETGIYQSSYGFGFRTGARYNICNNLAVGLDVNMDIYKYRELENKYLVIGFLAKAGYSFDFTEKVYGEAEIGLGLDIRKVGDRKQSTFGMDVYVGAGYRFTDSFGMTAGLDLEHGFTGISTDFAAKALLGATIVL